MRLGSGSLIFHPAQLRIIALGNFGCGSLVALQNTFAVVTVLEVRNHILILDASGKTVRQRAFQTVAYFNARASVLNGDDNERTVILLLAADAPLAQHFQSVILNRLAVESVDCQYSQLCCCFFVQLGAQTEHLLLILCRDDTGVILYVNAAAGRRTRRNGRCGVCVSGEEGLQQKQQADYKTFHYYPSVSSLQLAGLSA